MFSLTETFWLVFWATAALFTASILLELYLKRKVQKKRALENPHPDRIEFALHHIRHKDIKKVTNDLWGEITGVSHNTATMDLDALVDMGVLKRNGHGKGAHYTFIKHES